MVVRVTFDDGLVRGWEFMPGLHQGTVFKAPRQSRLLSSGSGWTSRAAPSCGPTNRPC